MLASHRQDQGPDTPAETIERFWHRGVSVSYILSLLPRCIEASFLKEVAGKLQMGTQQQSTVIGMKHESEYGMMLRHSYYLRAAMNLAANRQQQLQKTLDGLGFAKIPTDHEDFTLVQVEAAKEIGGINTRMLLDAPREIEKYHFGPLQIALCLLYAIIEKYSELSKADQMFQDDAFDRYCLEWFLAEIGAR